MLFRILTIYLLFLASAQAGLEQACEQLNGHIQQGFTCPRTKLHLPEKFCLFENKYGEKHFADGCTGPSGGHSDLFTYACIEHDLCYHHEPATSGKTQKMCDHQLLAHLNQACEESNKDLKKCYRWAKIMFYAVRGFGKLAYNCENKFVDNYLGL